MIRSAQISECGRFRPWLRRSWGEGLERPIMMLNPSDGDHERDDSTILKCCKFWRRDGYDKLLIVNVSDYRTPSPKVLHARGYPISLDGLGAVNDVVKKFDEIIVAWGNHAPDYLVEHHVSKFVDNGIKMLCFGVNKNGSPKHPLYLKDDTQLVAWTPNVEVYL